MSLDFLVPVIEWTWTLLAAVGVGVCIWALSDGYIDQARQRQSHRDGDAQMVTRMNLRAAHASVVLHGFFLVLGIYALIIPDRPFLPTFGLLGLGYITAAATNVRAIFLNQLDRVRARGGL